MTCPLLTYLAVAVWKALGSWISSWSGQFPIISLNLFLRQCRFKTLGLNCTGARKDLTPCLEIFEFDKSAVLLFSVTFDLLGQPFALPLTVELGAQLAESSS